MRPSEALDQRLDVGKTLLGAKHEARNPTDQDRVCLLVDLWHPSVTAVEREVITELSIAFNLSAGRRA